MARDGAVITPRLSRRRAPTEPLQLFLPQPTGPHQVGTVALQDFVLTLDTLHLPPCQDGGMGFFDRLPPPPASEPVPPQPPRPAWMKPEATLPGAVGRDLILARTPDAVVAISGLSAYPNGFLFTVTAVLREADEHPSHHGHFPRRAGEPVPERYLLVGVQFADGRATSNLHQHPRPYTVEPDGLMLLTDSGHGDMRRHDQTYWVWPLPPPGPVTFVCQWPAHAVPESHAEIDAGLILDAASRAIELWPE